MKILISNDDGIHSPGLIQLAQGLREMGNDVTVVAPHRERSTTSHSLTLHKPLRVFEHEKHNYSVSGSPADCVYFATRHLLKDSRPDIVISGINRGANLGHDIFYSGTVAAAREAALFGIPSIAISLACSFQREHDKAHWQTAVHFAKLLAPWFQKASFPKTHVLNVNVPNLEIEKIKGIRASRQGRRVYSDIVTESVDPRGKRYYWIGGNYTGFDQIPDSDCLHVDQGYISLVPLNTDTTGYELLGDLKFWEGLDFSKSL